MIAVTRSLVVSLALLAAGPAAAESVSVAFLHPEDYSDAIGRTGQAADSAVLDELNRHLQQLGARYLPAGRSLTVEILNIDLAGHYEPWAFRASELSPRIMRDVTWPKVTLRYQLVQDGGIVGSGEETVTDIDYLHRRNAFPSGDSLRYEKQMLADWFHARFGGGTAAGGALPAAAFGGGGGGRSAGVLTSGPEGIGYGGVAGGGRSRGGGGFLSALFPGGSGPGGGSGGACQ